MKLYIEPKADVVYFDADTAITASTQTVDGPIAQWQKGYDGTVATVSAGALQDVLDASF